ncbi:VOC family protein [Nitrospirillum sp. BR 11164]|uniref:VOC family protein n=1 Tax=Nitrospirillum sp. BR 11164 TaxID=3104324 RepID=UPI002AFEBBE3|nr:VOC family protein [Nitrospirillum sp. BR 11164]MEA1650800.1 VOC family protein [Nitrospirillum sp. BR 11164]
MSDAIQTMHPLQQGVIPHLVVGDAKAALAFYAQALGAEEVFRMPAQDGDRLLHAEIRMNGARLFLRDDFPEYRAEHGGTSAPPALLRGTSVVMHLEVPNCDAAMDRAVAAGAAVTMPAIDAFWGARYGQVADPFGHLWSFAHPLGAPGEPCPLAAGQAAP